MGDFLRIILDSIHFLWPLRIVSEWERGGYYVRGKWWREVGPGLHLVCPWFTDVIVCSVVEAIIGTHRQDITLSDGKVLSFQASATVRVKDVQLALNAVDDFKETSVELLASVLAERLADVDADRMSPSKRNRLFSDLKRWVQEEADAYGLEFTHVRLTSCVLNARVFRLMGDDAAGMAW